MTCHSAPQPVTLEGHIEKVSFYDRENQFTIARFQVTGTDNLVTVLGLLPHPHPGSALRITGTWETHARYGQQLRIITAEMVLPATTAGIRQYLASGFVRGVGARTIARLVNHFQGETLVRPGCPLCPGVPWGAQKCPESSQSNFGCTRWIHTPSVRPGPACVPCGAPKQFWARPTDSHHLGPTSFAKWLFSVLGLLPPPQPILKTDSNSTPSAVLIRN